MAAGGWIERGERGEKGIVERSTALFATKELAVSSWPTEVVLRGSGVGMLQERAGAWPSQSNGVTG